MTIVPYKQTFTHSCLVADFLMLLKNKYNISFNEKDEEEILIKGMKRIYPFYVIGIPRAFFNKYNKKINIVVDNKYFTNFLIDGFNDKNNFNVYHNKITIRYIKELLKENSVICHIDDNYLGDYSHASHFIILENSTDKRITIIDPMNGKRTFISDEKLEKSIQSLKKHIKMCPLLFYL